MYQLVAQNSNDNISIEQVKPTFREIEKLYQATSQANIFDEIIVINLHTGEVIIDETTVETDGVYELCVRISKECNWIKEREDRYLCG